MTYVISFVLCYLLGSLYLDNWVLLTWDLLHLVLWAICSIILGLIFSSGGSGGNNFEDFTNLMFD